MDTWLSVKEFESGTEGGHWNSSSVLMLVGMGFLLRLGLVVSILFVTGGEGFVLPDSGSYLSSAESIVQQGSFLGNQGLPQIVRSPGYPVFLAVGFLMGIPKLWGVVVQSVLGACLVLAVVELSKQLGFDQSQGTLAGVLLAMEPLSILYSAKIMTETLFTVLLMLFILSVLRLIRVPSYRNVIFSAILLVTATYVRPITLYLPIILLFLFGWLAWKRKDWLKWLGYTTIFLFVFYGLVAGWVYRNYTVADYPHFSAVSARTVYRYHAAAVKADLKDVSYYEMRESLKDQELDYRDLPRSRAILVRAKNFESIRSKGLSILVNNPFVYIPIHLNGMVRVMLDPGAVEYLRAFSLYPENANLLGKVVSEGVIPTLIDLQDSFPLLFWSNVILGIALGGYLVGAVLGATGWIINRGFTAQFTFLLLLVLYFWVLSGGPNSTSRFRTPLMPLISLLAAYGLTHGIKRLRSHF
jgi:hypothetical protein